MSRVAGAYALFALLLLMLEALVAARYGELLRLFLSDPDTAKRLAMAAAAVLLLVLVLGVWTLVKNLLRPRDARGRSQLSVGAAAGIVNVLGCAACVLVLITADLSPILRSSLALGLPPHVKTLIGACVAVIGLSGAAVLGASLACWFLLDKRPRKKVWLVVDAVLLMALGAAVMLLPVRPLDTDPDALALPIVRHTITALAVLRMVARLLPPLLDFVEWLGLEPLVAARHLRTAKSGFLAAISALSVLAVTVSCCALTTTLSVMGGFRDDLKRKILGNNAHVVIDRDHQGIEEWAPVLAAASTGPEVVGVSPFVQGEVMLSSASNLATAVLRGIDPETIGEVTDLPKNLKSGDLKYLQDPEQLLKLPRDLLSGVRLRLHQAKRAPPDPEKPANRAKQGARPDQKKPALAAERPKSDARPDQTKPASLTDRTGPPYPSDQITEAERIIAETESLLAQAKRIEAEPMHKPLEAEPRAPEGQSEPAKESGPDIDRYLREPEPETKKEKTRGTLPGIIVGQELARALRLYLGDEVNVVAPLGALGPSGPMPKSRAFRVAGIFFSGMYEYDMKHAYVELGAAQRFLGTGDAINGIEVKVEDPDRAPATAAALRKDLELRHLRVRDWQELNSRLFGALELEKLVMFLLLGIAILVASFCIAGTLTLMVQEKGREVAILKAMGTGDRTVVGVFIVEGGLIGALGAVLGLFFGYMVCFAAEHFGIRMDPEVYYIDRLPVHIDAVEFSMVGLAAVGVCLLVTIYPALLASRLRPVEALRYE